MMYFLLNEKLQSKINYGIIALTIIINIIALFYLPKEMGIHINTQGEIDSSISKYIGILIVPIGMALLSFLQKNKAIESSKKLMYLITNIILFFVNGYMLLFNLTL
ncbi:DUF1648 domain-containing protein [Clostridium paraputrificum]|uniref:DUF1648 domain-containing protein n=1 Tax=Clostridium paraputrificum TaxID=29363 RepID=UPI00325AEA6C